MIQVQPFKLSLGFGNGDQYPNGEYLFSEGMKKSLNGMIPGWAIGEYSDSAGLLSLGNPLWFTQAKAGAQPASVYSVDSSGQIFVNPGGNTSWSLAYIPGVASFGNGLIGDQKGRLLYFSQRYLGLYDGTANQTGTCSVTNGSPNVTGSGTAWTSALVGKRFQITSDAYPNGWYTVQSVTDNTHLVLTANYTGTTAGSDPFAIYVGWTDQYKDFGAGSLALANDFRPADTYEDWVVIGNGANVALFNVTDDSFNANDFNFYTSYKVISICSGNTGVLIGVNTLNRCAFVLWDTFSNRSIAPWIWKNGSVQCIIPNNGRYICVTNRVIFSTTGYTSTIVSQGQDLPSIPDPILGQTSFITLPQGGTIVDDYLLLSNRLVSVNRKRGGVWALSLKTNLWEYIPTLNGATYNNSMGPIFFDSNTTIHLGWQTTNPSKTYLGYVSNGAPSRAYAITAPLGSADNNQKTAKGVKLNLGLAESAFNYASITFTASVKITNFKRQLWSYANEHGTAGANNQLKVDGTQTTFNKAQIGDEVQIMEGTNAGQFAHITAITNQGLITETWTLDTNLSGLTEDGMFIAVSPFKLIAKKVITSQAQLRDLYYNCQNLTQGKTFLLKILFENLTQIPPELIGGDFIYDDKGEESIN